MKMNLILWLVLMTAAAIVPGFAGSIEGKWQTSNASPSYILDFRSDGNWYRLVKSDKTGQWETNTSTGYSGQYKTSGNKLTLLGSDGISTMYEFGFIIKKNTLKFDDGPFKDNNPFTKKKK